MGIDNELAVIIFRGFDRLLISGGGIISIWLGYKLFNKILPDNGSFDGGVGSWSLRMKNIAPGVFFALFGASTLIFSITNSLSYEKGVDGDKFNGMISDSALRLDGERALEILNAVSVINIYKNKSADNLTPNEINKLNDSYAKLFTFQISLIDKVFGPGSFDKYQEISSELRRDPESFKKYSEQDRELYQTIKTLFVQ